MWGNWPFRFKVSVKPQSPDVFGHMLDVEKHSGEAGDENLADGQDFDEFEGPIR